MKSEERTWHERLRRRLSSWVWRQEEREPQESRPQWPRWPRPLTDRLSLPVSHEAVAEFFRSPEWRYACLFLAEARDQAVRKLAAVAPTDVAEVARLQQEIGTLTVVIGDEEGADSLASMCHDEILASLTEAGQETQIA